VEVTPRVARGVVGVTLQLAQRVVARHQHRFRVGMPTQRRECGTHLAAHRMDPPVSLGQPLLQHRQALLQQWQRLRRRAARRQRAT
jgi:hypothetical protein